MSVWIVFAVYALISATGLFLIKTGADNTSMALSEGLFKMQLSPRLLAGFVLYLTSFVLSVYVMSRMKLSLFYPMGTGSILVLTCLFGFFFLKEQIGAWQLLGMALILAGVVAMNIKAV